MARRTILFAQLDPFSYTNDALAIQFSRHLSEFNIEGVRVFDVLKRRLPVVAANLLEEIIEYGPTVMFNDSRMRECFLKTPYLFSWMSEYFRRRYNQHSEISAVFQTQGLFNASLCNVPLICYTDNTFRNRAFLKREDEIIKVPDRLIELEALLYRRADAIAVSASHVRASLLADYGCEPERVTTVLIGANVSVPQSSAIAGRYKRQRILFIGIDWARKGGADLVKAFELVADRYPQATLTIAGSRPNVTHARIRTLGRVPKNVIPSLIAESSIFCLPSLVEPSSVAAIEASRGGLPVIATKVGGFLDSVEAQVTGLLVPPREPERLAEALAYLLERPELCEQMGIKGAERANTMFNWNSIGPRIANIIRQCVVDGA